MTTTELREQYFKETGARMLDAVDYMLWLEKKHLENIESCNK